MVITTHNLLLGRVCGGLKLMVFLLMFLALQAVSPPMPLAEEEPRWVTGAVSAEAWYAQWKADNQWAKQNVDISYDVEPALISGYSASISYLRDNRYTTNILLDYLTSVMEESVSGKEFGSSVGEHAAYMQMKATLNQAVGDKDYFHISVMRAEFEGNVKIANGGKAFGVADGTSMSLNTTWVKVDALYLFNGIGGVGFRYLHFKKPEATSLFHADSGVGSSSEGTLLSGTLLDTDFKTYNLIFGLWDPSYIGIPTASIYFYNAAAFVGVANIHNSMISQGDAWSGGLEGDLGLKYSAKFTEDFGLTGRLGFRVIYSKIQGQEETVNENEYLVTESLDFWYGPFLSIAGTF